MGKDLKQEFLQKSYRNGQQAHEKMPKIIREKQIKMNEVNYISTKLDKKIKKKGF